MNMCPTPHPRSASPSAQVGCVSADQAARPVHTTLPGPRTATRWSRGSAARATAIQTVSCACRPRLPASALPHLLCSECGLPLAMYEFAERPAASPRLAGDRPRRGSGQGGPSAACPIASGDLRSTRPRQPPAPQGSVLSARRCTAPVCARTVQALRHPAGSRECQNPQPQLRSPAWLIVDSPGCGEPTVPGAYDPATQILTPAPPLCHACLQRGRNEAGIKARQARGPVTARSAGGH